MNVLVVDYGMGNLGSVRRSLEECGADVQVSEDPKDLLSAEGIILPGVGAFADAMKQLNDRGWIEPLRESVLAKRIPLLGICLGMQVLADQGVEGGVCSGLGLIPGEVILLQPPSSDVRIPHVGWNEVHPVQASPLFEKIESGTDFYFVHSYHFVTKDPKYILARTPYCGDFTCAVGHENIFGVQFHPEKSSRPGFQLIRNFLNYSGVPC